MSGNLVRPQPGKAAPNYKASVPTFAQLPAAGNVDGDLRLTLDTNKLYIWDQPTTSWVLSVTAPSNHALGGSSHTADSLANLNLKISDGTVIDTGDSRFSDDRDPNSHGLGNGTRHSSATLAQLNALVSDATLDDSSAARTPSAHALGGAEHSVDTLANLNGKVSDATLIDTGDSRLSDARTPTQHGLGNGTYHASATLAQLNALVSDATLIDTADSRLSDDRDPKTHGIGDAARHTSNTLAQVNALITDANVDDDGDPRDPNAHTHRIPIILTFFVASADMSVGTTKGKPNRLRVHPGRGAFTLEHTEIEHAVSASVTVDINKGAGDGAATTIYTTQGNRPATSSATRDTSPAPDVTTVANDDYFEMDIDVLSGSPGDMVIYIRGYKDVAITP